MEIVCAKELFKSDLNKKQQENSKLDIQELESKQLKLKSYPRRIVLEMTSACNIKCIFCGRDEAEFNQTYLKLDVLEKLKPALEHCEEVTLFGWGEPTINPKFSQFLEKLDETGVSQYFAINRIDDNLSTMDYPLLHIYQTCSYSTQFIGGVAC